MSDTFYTHIIYELLPTEIYNFLGFETVKALITDDNYL